MMLLLNVHTDAGVEAEREGGEVVEKIVPGVDGVGHGAGAGGAIVATTAGDDDHVRGVLVAAVRVCHVEGGVDVATDLGHGKDDAAGRRGGKVDRDQRGGGEYCNWKVVRVLVGERGGVVKEAPIDAEAVEEPAKVPDPALERGEVFCGAGAGG
jgi:hypothetical protein